MTTPSTLPNAAPNAVPDLELDNQEPRSAVAKPETRSAVAKQEFNSAPANQEQASVERCGNCRTELHGPFCHMCGQPVRSPVRELFTVIKDSIDELVALDGKLWRSLWPLYFRPGYLVQRYVEGQRVHFVKPLKLYLSLSIIVFLVMSMSTTIADKDEGNSTGIRVELSEKDRSELSKAGGLQRIKINGKAWHPTSNPLVFESLPDWANSKLNNFMAHLDRTIHRVADDPDLLVSAFYRMLPTAIFLLLPIAALVLKIFYLFRSKLYAEHLLVALQCHSFVFVSFLVIMLLGTVGAWTDGAYPVTNKILIVLIVAAAFWVPIYLFLTLKRVYRQGWILTSLKYLAISMIYFLLISLALTGALVAGLVTA